MTVLPDTGRELFRPGAYIVSNSQAGFNKSCEPYPDKISPGPIIEPTCDAPFVSELKYCYV